MVLGFRRSLALALVLAASAATAFAAPAKAPAAGAIDPDLLAGFRARNVGPAGMSGRVTSIAGVASNPDVLYVGAATGGVWKSTNAGLTWTPIFDDQPVHAIGALAVVQENPDVVWVGTGEGNVRNSASVGEGIFKSSDGGKTWTRMGLERTERIYRILVSPRDENVVWACALGREWGENPERGVFRTTDGGKSWSKVLYVDEKTGCGELALDPHNPDRLVAGMWQFRRWPWFFASGGPGSAMYTTADGGTTWRKLQEEDGLPGGELGRMGIAFAPSEPGLVYALVEAKKSALLRSTDAGRTWQTVNDRDNIAARPFYFCDIRVDPRDAHRIYSLHYTVDVSEDGGRSFRGLRGMNDIHGDLQAMWIDPNDAAHLWVGNDGGIAESRDHGRTFRFVAALPVAQFYHVQVDDDVPYHVYGGLQDNGSWRGPSSVWQAGGIGGSEWVVVSGGDGFETIPHPKDSSIVYAEAQGGELSRSDIRTGEARGIKPAAPAGVTLRFNWNAALAVDPFEPDTVYLGSQFVHKSTDRGASWTTISPDLTTNNPEWQKADESGGLTPDASRAENYTTLLQIVPSPVERGVIWTGSDDGRVHVTRDGGKTWTSVEKNVPGVPANTWVPHIKASRYGGGTAFAVFDNHRRSDWTPYVARTDDYGKTWTSLSTPDLRGYALAIEQDPMKPELLFLGTEFGLYVSLDAGRKWTRLEKTLPTASVMDLVIHPREHDLVVATHGRALWILDDVRPFRELSAAALAEPLHFYPAAPAQQLWLRPPVAGFGLGQGEFRGDSRPYGAILTYSLNVPGLALQDDDKERARKEQERVAAAARAAREAADEAKAKPAKSAAPAGAKPESAVPANPAPPAAADTKPENPPEKVEITVTDASGRVVRRFKGPAKLGVNRVVWDLGSDPFKAQPQGDNPRGGGGDDERSGPEVTPGTYTVTVKLGDHTAAQTVSVLADPRSPNTAADWAARAAAVEELRGLADTLTDAIWRLRRTRDDVAAVQAKAKQVAQDGGEKDPKKLGELPLVKDGGKLVEALNDLEKRLWQAPEGIGIRPSVDVQSRIYEAYDVLSSWDPPSPNDRAKLAAARAQVEGAVGDLNKLFAGDVAAFRARAEEAKLGLFSNAAELRVPRR